MSAATPTPDGSHDENVTPLEPLAPEQRQMPEAPVTEGRDRAGLAAEAELNPLSLIGSWFHRLENGRIVWDGLIVGEPQPGKYLMQVRQGLDGLERGEAQVLMPLERMFAQDEGYEFRLYDSAEQMQAAYAEYVVRAEFAEEAS